MSGICTSTVAFVQVRTACGAQPPAILAAQDDERRIHDHGIRDGIAKIDDSIMTDKLKAVLIVLGILGLLEQVVFLDLTGDVYKRQGVSDSMTSAVRQRSFVRVTKSFTTR